MKLAVLSDTHGNLTAFEAVLANIDACGIDRVFNLGDLAGKGPRGSACCELTRARCEVTVLGNWDVSLLGAIDAAHTSGSRWWRDELSSENLEWLAQLPFSIDLTLAETRIRMFHASSDDVYHRITRSVGDEEFAEQFRNTDATGDATPPPTVVIYGDIHFAWEKTVGNHMLINCGAVGNPLDEPTASYIVLDDSTGELTWELVRVPYDIESELAIAREMKMPQYDAWEQELRSAIYAR